MNPAAPTTSRGDVTRRKLLDAAKARFARDGYRSTSVTDIARDAELGGTTAYVHFPTKEALFLASVDDDLSALFDELLGAMARLDRDGDRVEGLFNAVLVVVGEHPLAGRLLAGLEPRITGRVLESDAFGVLRGAVAERLGVLQADGQTRPDIEPGVLADGLVALVVAVSMAAVQVGEAFLDRFSSGLASLFESVLTPDPRLAEGHSGGAR